MRNALRAIGWALPCACALLLRPTAAAPASEAVFTDATQAVRLDFAHQHSPTSNKYLIETMGGGVALVDYDNDGRLDMFFTNGAQARGSHASGAAAGQVRSAVLEPAVSPERGRRRSPTSARRAGVTGMPQNRYDMGVAVGDYDNDGFADLYVTGYGGNTLYRNDGRRHVRRCHRSAPASAAGGWSASAGFFDADNDGDLDLFVSRYVTWSFEKNGYCGEKKPGYRAYCHPDNYEGVANVLFRNNGDGTFTDVSAKAGIANPAGKGLGVAFADYDADGRLDVYVANDSVQSVPLSQRRRGHASPRWACWRAWGSTRTARPSRAWASISPTTTTTAGPISSSPTSRTSGIGCSGRMRTAAFATSRTRPASAPRRLPFSGWSTRLFDYDNDGWKDLFVAQGHVMDTIEKTVAQSALPPAAAAACGTRPGRFVRVEPGGPFARDWAGRGAAFGDLDNDGDLDVVMSSVGQKAVVLRNDGGNRRAWIAIRTVGTRSNRDGIGCRIKVTSASGLAQDFTVTTAVGYLSASDRRLIVGLGADTSASRVEVRWPSGAVQTFDRVEAGRTLVATEPER